MAKSIRQGQKSKRTKRRSLPERGSPEDDVVVGTCAHCKQPVHRGDRAVVTASDKDLHLECVEPFMAHVNESPKNEHVEANMLTCAECGKPVAPEEEQFWGELCLHKEPCDRIWHKRHGPKIEVAAAELDWQIADDSDPF